MIIFKAVVIGLLAWNLYQLLKKKKQPQQTDPTYIIVPSDKVDRIPELFDQRGPPPEYYPGIKQPL